MSENNIPDIFISCQMCNRVGSSDAVNVYLLGNHVFLQYMCSILPEEDGPPQTMDSSVISLE